ncbi:MAG TPA: hypothetical protein PKA33_03685 [Amaricoccus sp.]|uniref:hypothetical protein n=1 Tax=Amaricoccus sp. TaxID=1872485 RepID=UPI002C010EA7|nr:hypothetical protein [Amaricoccus sp.]HMQ92356.1 hypothetical protein [Amaricoccus sp.]HMR51610.1 hypothetical protein [Amaricoccus sp.]HMR61083.1 hypothetical protein [Amaricoccus sp.]HMT98454.1 hypothetical protein [Amaricoccus sp.]
MFATTEMFEGIATAAFCGPSQFRRPSRRPVSGAALPVVRAVRATVPGRIVRDCMNLHWAAVATEIGCAPDAIGERDGTAGPHFVACILSLAPGAFEGAARIGLEPELFPTAANGWRSVTRLEGRGGSGGTVELVSAFGAGPSGRSPEGARTRLLAARAASARETAREEALGLGRPPALVVPVSGTPDPAGAGRLPLTGWMSLFDRAEAAATLRAQAPVVAVSREFHCCGRVEDGDAVELSCTPSAADAPEVSCFGHAARRSDGAIVATCETRLIREDGFAISE